MNALLRISIGIGCSLALLNVFCFPAAGQTTLLFEDFNSGFPSSWTHYDGGLSAAGGFINLSSGCVVLPGTFDRSQGLAIEAEVNITWAGAGDFNIFGLYDLYNPPAPHCLYIVTDGYGFGFYPAGSDNPDFLLDAVVDGVLNRASAPATIAAGQWTHVRAEIEASGGFRLLVDGVERVQNFDLTHQHGPIVLRTWGDVFIDNVRVETLSSCIYGPAGQPLAFHRSTGPPRTEKVEWQSCGGTGVLSVATNHVSSAILMLNGATIMRPSDFQPNTLSYSIPVDLVEGTNFIEVEVRGKPGSLMTLSFSSSH